MEVLVRIECVDSYIGCAKLRNSNNSTKKQHKYMIHDTPAMHAVGLLVNIINNYYIIYYTCSNNNNFLLYIIHKESIPLQY